MMISRVMNDWTHWRIGSHVHFGFNYRGQCYRFWKLPRAQKYRSGRLTYFTWWRLFIAVDKD